MDSLIVKLEVSPRDLELVRSLIEILNKHIDSLPEELKTALAHLEND